MSISFTHPDIVKTWHPEKNGTLSPDNYTFGSDTRITWICPNKCPEGCEHVYEAQIKNRIRNGCPYCCPNAKRVCKHTSLLHVYPEVAKELHPKNKETADLLPVMSPKKVWWLCDKVCPAGCKHEWEASIGNRTGRGDKCPYCSNKKLCEHMSIKYTHPELMNEWHPEKNTHTKPEELSYGSDVKVNWICVKNKEHEWITSVSHRASRGTGCPKCLHKTEDKLYLYLSKKYTVVRQFTLDSCKRKKHLPFDFCIPDLKIIIELDGGQHFRIVRNWGTPEYAVNRDIFKTQHANKNGYSVIRICQEDVYANGEDWLDASLLDEMNKPDIHNTFISTIDTLYDSHIELLEKGEDITLLQG
jgi:very-short-patch-repair endonuclease